MLYSEHTKHDGHVYVQWRGAHLYMSGGERDQVLMQRGDAPVAWQALWAHAHSVL